MQANPLLGASGADKEKEKPKSSPDQRVITLVSNAPANEISGLEGFLSTFNTGEVRAEIEPFRHVIQRRVRRSMGGKFSKGLSQEVVENVEINPNQDLFGLRRWVGGIRQNPASVMLVNINKVKDNPLAAPLGFSELMKSGRPILVSGADRSVQDQIFAKIYPDCSQIPVAVQNNTSLKTMLLARTQRRKGFVGTMRNLMDLEFLPKATQDKVAKVTGGGDPSELSEAETINLSLLADMASRYQNALIQYKEYLDSGSMNVQQLTGMFEMLLADVPMETAIKQFSEFLGKDDERPEQVRSKAELFGFINRYLNATGGGTKGVTRSQKLDSVFKRLNSVFLAQRIKVDPILWRRCNFIYEPEPEEKQLLASLEPLMMFVQNTVEGGDEAVTEGFKEKFGSAVFEMVTLSNMPLEEAQKDGGMARQRAAQYLLPKFQMGKFQATHLVQIGENNKGTLLNKDKFLGLFKNIPITTEDLKGVLDKLNQEFQRDAIITKAVRSSTLDVLVGHAKDREKALRDIYIINAAQELVNFSFHLGDKKISGIDRLSGIAVMNTRFGFEVSASPIHESSIGLFVKEEEVPLGKLNNDASVISRAYTALVAMQVERQVKKLVDHKIGYLQATFGDNFFEVIYRSVITKYDLPLSRNQLAWIVKERGLLGSLGEKGFKSERENDLLDTFITIEEKDDSSLRKKERDFSEFDKFEVNFQAANRAFKKLLAELKSHSEADPTRDVHSLVWSLYKRGIYNLERQDAKDAFRKSEFYNQLKELIAKISSENYSVFTKDIQEEGVKIYLMPVHHDLLTLGARFAYLVESKVVRYQLVGSPAETMEELDPVSRVFNEKMSQLRKEEAGEFTRLFTASEEVARATQVWREHSRYLAFVLLDRFLSETVIKQLQPGRIQPKNLWYLPDSVKLCLGASLAGQNTVPFAKILQVPENMGNIQKNPKSSSTTIDDFTIEVHKISRLRDELENIESIAEDVLDIVQNLTHERAEGQLVAKYEQGLHQLIRLLSRPLRYVTEKDVQALHVVTKSMRDALHAFYNTPGTLKDQLVNRVQTHLQTRRSDGHNLKLNFTDAFILDKTEIKVMQKVKQGDQVVSKQKKMEVEVDTSYQTLSIRIREVIRTHQILAQKKQIVLSPEGQKKKQIEYIMDIIDVLQSLRGSALTFFVDSTMMSDSQMNTLAMRIKPHHFFRMDDVKPEPAEGMKVTGVKDPLTGRLVKKQGETPAAPTGA